MNKKYSDTILILIIFLSALCIRIVYFYFIFDIRTPLTQVEMADQRLYDSIATSLWQNKEFSVASGEPTGAVLPVYPLFLAAIYYIFGHSFVAVRIAQTLISCLSCILIFFIAKNLFNRTTALFSGLLLSISPAMVYLTGALMNESLFIFLLMITVCFAMRFKKRGLQKDNIFFAISLAICILTKEIMLPFVFFSVIWYLSICESFKKALISLFMSILIIIFLFLPWTIRNHKIYGDFAPTLTMAGGALWEGNHPSAKGYHVPPQDKDWQAIGLKNPRNPIWGSEDGLTEAERRKLYTKHILDWLIKHPKHFLKLIPIKFIYFWGPITQATNETAKRFTLVYSIFYSIILVLAILGIAFSRKKIKELLLIYLLFIYFTIVACATVVITRFRLPLEPFYIMLASYSLLKVFLRLKINEKD